MALNARKIKNTGSAKGPKQEAMEAGTYSCRVVQMVDQGLQAQRPYKGEEKPPAYSMSLTYEFVDEFCKDKDGNDDETKPRWLSEEMPLYSLDADLAKSTKRYKAIDPQEVHDGDFSMLAGMGCMVTITCKPNKDGENRNYISSVSAMRAKDLAKIPELVNDAKVFLLDEPDLEVLGSFPDWLQEKIKTNLEFSGSVLEKVLAGGAAPKAEGTDVKSEAEAKSDDSSDDSSDDEGW